MTGHTPGPWTVKKVHADVGFAYPYYAISGGQGFYDAGRFEPEHPCGFHLTGMIAIQDARIIAAAPEMLAALHLIRDDVMGRTQSCGIVPNTTIHTISAAIRLATEQRR